MGRRGAHHNVMISSTSRDLPAYRNKAKDAVWRADLFPLMMERDGAMNMDAVAYSLELVDQADAYVGIFAHRYGYIPPGSDVSITEMEYRRAIERGIPILCFVIDADYAIPVTPETMGIYFEADATKKAKLEAFKSEILRQHVVAFFTTPEDLSAHIFQALAEAKARGIFGDVEDAPRAADPRLDKIPVAPPDPYYAHPYILTRQFFGRQSELQIINEWVASDDSTLIFEAIGGMGKSALTWHWVNQHAADFAGVVWWSFYESESSVARFVRNTLAYLTDQPLTAIDRLSYHEREARLLDALKQGRHLLVLDGIERIMVAYHRMDAPMVSDEAIEAGQRTEQDKQHQRACIDPRHGELLRNLITCVPTKVLISTRLCPRDLENRHTGQLLPGVRRHQLRGIYPAEEALGLLNHLGVYGDERAIMDFCGRFDYHALILTIIAGLVLNYRADPGNFDAWLADEGQDFRLSEHDISQRRTGILEIALDGLTPELEKLLSQVAHFRYPVDYEALLALRSGRHPVNAGLDELEDRGLLQWDRRTNRYDLHPVVRAYAFERLDESERVATYGLIRDHFERQPPEDLRQVKSVDDLRRSLEIYYALVGAGLRDDAARFYLDHLRTPMYNDLGVFHSVVELLKPLFVDGFGSLPDLTEPAYQGYFITELANSLGLIDQVETALQLSPLEIRHNLRYRDATALHISVINYGVRVHSLHRPAAAMRAYKITEDIANASRSRNLRAKTEFYLFALAVDIGHWTEAETRYERFLEAAPFMQHEGAQFQAWAAARDAQLAICRNIEVGSRLEKAHNLAESAREARQIGEVERWRGECMLAKGDLAETIEVFHNALSTLRRSGMSTYILCARLALAHARQGNFQVSRGWLAEVLQDPDHENVAVSIAETYLELGETDQARAFVFKGYARAWADGPPYSYWWPLERARAVLAALGIDEAEVQHEMNLTPFDPSQVEPIPYEDEIRAFIEALKSEGGQP